MPQGLITDCWREAYFDRFFLLTVSFSSLPTLKRTVLLALMLMDSPVAGLRPLRALRSDSEKLPNPGTFAPSPDRRASVIASKTASNASVACLRLSPSTLSTIALTKSSLPAILPLLLTCHLDESDRPRRYGNGRGLSIRENAR